VEQQSAATPVAQQVVRVLTNIQRTENVSMVVCVGAQRAGKHRQVGGKMKKGVGSVQNNAWRNVEAARRQRQYQAGSTAACRRTQ